MAGKRDSAVMIKKYGRILPPRSRGRGNWAKPTAEDITAYKDDLDARQSHWKHGDWSVPNDPRID